MENLTKISGCEFHRKRIVCLANIFTVAGTEPACDSCTPSLPHVREVLHCEEIAPGLFLSADLSPEKKTRVEAAIAARKGQEALAL